MQHITEEDVGKSVVNQTGEKIGTVSGVQGGTAYVDPDPGLGDSIKAKLGWDDPSSDDFQLEEQNIESVMDDEIRLR